MTDAKYLPIRILRGMINAVHDAVVITTAGGFDEPHPQIVYVNPAFTAISGYTFEEAVGKSPRMLQGSGTDRGALARIRQSLLLGQSCREEILNYHKDGSSYWLDIHIVPLYGEDDKITHFAAIERDITKQRNRLKRLQSFAQENFLTGLADRAALDDHLEHLMALDRSPSHTLAVFELEGLKPVNKSFEYYGGDALLQKFASILAANMGGEDFVARLGGDKFALVLRSTDVIEARIITHRIVTDTRCLCSSDPSSGNLEARVGVAQIRAGSSIETAMAVAEDDLHSAKRREEGTSRISRPKALKQIA